MTRITAIHLLIAAVVVYTVVSLALIWILIDTMIQQSTGSGNNALERRTRRIGNGSQHIWQRVTLLSVLSRRTRVSLLLPGFLLFTGYSQFAVYNLANIFQTFLQKDQDRILFLLIFILIIKRETFPDLKKRAYVQFRLQFFYGRI